MSGKAEEKKRRGEEEKKKHPVICVNQCNRGTGGHIFI
jgi:hypothetical protein